MENKSENIDRYFKERLGELEQNPPESNWDNIAAKLGHSKNKKGLALLIFSIAAGMALLVSTGIGFYLLTKAANQSEPAVLSINQGEVTPKDTIKPERPNKINHVAILEKETNKSDRLEPIRIVNNSPVISDKVTFENDIQNDLKENTGDIANLRNHYQPAPLTKIVDHNRQYLLPVYLPSALTYTRLSPATTILTKEEALALLLPPSEEVFENEDIKHHDRWKMGSEIAPLYSYRSISSNDLGSDKINDLNDTENGLLAYAGGINLAYAKGKRLSVQSGIYYSRYGQEKNKIETYRYRYAQFASEGLVNGRYISVSNSTGVISSDIPEGKGYDKVVSNSIDATSNTNTMIELMGVNTEYNPSENLNVTLLQHFNYLEVPLLIKYKIIDRKFDFCLSGGVVTNFLVGNTVDIVQDGETSRFGKTKDINQVNYQGSFGLGFEYPIASGFAFTIEPRFRYYINPIDKSSQINVHPYSFGFFTGISYIF